MMRDRLSYEIVPARVRHIGPLIATMCAARREMEERKFGPLHRHIRRKLFPISPERYTILLDGNPVGMWGVSGSALSSKAYIWAIVSETATRFPVALIKESRAQIDRLMETHTELYSLMDPQDKPLARWARALGFSPTGESVEGSLLMSIEKWASKL